MNVYQAINAVQADLVKSGIGKDSTNTYDNYKFRGIDAVYNALSPLLAKHGLCVLPRMVSRICEERASQKGGALFYVTVEAEFDFVSAEDGSKHTVRTFGEAMDRGDKATNKAMSAAYKYAAFQAFAIPTEGDNDADATTHEVARREPETNQHGKRINRTLVMQVSRAIAENIAEGKELGALQEWEGAQETGEEFAGEVWARLTSPERDKLRELQTAAAISPERAKVLKDEVRRIVAACRGLRTDAALEVYDKITDRREREYVWRELDSEPKVQDIITAAYEARKQPA